MWQVWSPSARCALPSGAIPWLLLTLEDFTSKMTVVIFPKTYQDCSSFLVQDAVVAIEGRFALMKAQAR
jgi:DNA polymerase III alpha subunit